MRPVSVPISPQEFPNLRAPRLEQPAAPGEFTRSLEAAVSSLEATQLEGDAEASKLAQGAGNLHETMLALEKADVAMRVAVKVRNKVIDAYNEVMRMSV